MYSVPHVRALAGPRRRMADAGRDPACASIVRSAPGERVPPDYDPIIAKLMTVGSGPGLPLYDRMRRALDEVVVTGIQTTLPFDRALMVIRPSPPVTSRRIGWRTVGMEQQTGRRRWTRRHGSPRGPPTRPPPCEPPQARQPMPPARRPAPRRLCAKTPSVGSSWRNAGRTAATWIAGRDQPPTRRSAERRIQRRPAPSGTSRRPAIDRPPGGCRRARTACGRRGGRPAGPGRPPSGRGRRRWLADRARRRGRRRGPPCASVRPRRPPPARPWRTARGPCHHPGPGRRVAVEPGDAVEAGQRSWWWRR